MAIGSARAPGPAPEGAAPGGRPAADGSPLSVRQAARRQGVLDAALALLQESDYDRVHVRQVADRASVALATVYHYFPSKEHLFGEALVQWAGTMRTGLSRPLRPGNPADRLKEALRRSVRAFERQPQLARLVGSLEGSDEPFAHYVLDRLDQVTTEVYLDTLADLDRDLAIRVVRVVDAVLDAGLRGWCSGRLRVDEVYSALVDAVDLVLPGPEQPGA